MSMSEFYNVDVSTLARKLELFFCWDITVIKVLIGLHSLEVIYHIMISWSHSIGFYLALWWRRITVIKVLIGFQFVGGNLPQVRGNFLILSLHNCIISLKKMKCILRNRIFGRVTIVTETTSISHAEIDVVSVTVASRPNIRFPKYWRLLYRSYVNNKTTKNFFKWYTATGLLPFLMWAWYRVE